MRQILFLFFTFSGICSGFAQKPVQPVDSAQLKEKPIARIFPNPAKNKVEIELKGFDPGYVVIQLLDNNGKLKREEKRLVFTGNEIIVFMFSEKPGLYLMWLKQGEKKLKVKLVIQ